MTMIYMKLLLFCLLIATTVAQGHRRHRRDRRRRRLQKERYVCTIDDTEHCQDPTESYMISCSMDTCAWATDELKSDKWPSECDTLDVSQEEIDQQDVPDWWEPCLLWVQMFGPPPPPQMDTESPTDSPTDSPTESPTDSPTSAPLVVPPPPTLAPSSETDSTITSGPTVDLNPVGNETVPVGNETVPAPPTGNETTPGGGTPPVNQTKPDDGGESNNSTNPATPTNSTTPPTSTSTTVDLETLLLTYIFTPETTRRRLQVKLPVAVILNRTTEFLLVTLRTTLPVTDLTLELVITQTLSWPNKTELVATTLSGQVVLSEEATDDQVKSEIYGIVNAAFENDAPEYVNFLQLSQDDAPALNQLYAVKSGMLPSEFEAEGGTDNNIPAAATSSEESSWYQEPYFPAVIAGATCLFLAVLIGFIVMHRNRNRQKPKPSKRVAGTVPQTMTTETGQMESDEHNYDNYDINEDDDDDDDELVSVLFDAANEARPVKSLD